MPFGTKMRTSAIHRVALGAIVALVGAACGGTTIRIPMFGSPMTVGQNTIDFDQDGIMDFFVKQ